jgi:hypothetical protein
MSDLERHAMGRRVATDEYEYTVWDTLTKAGQGNENETVQGTRLLGSLGHMAAPHRACNMCSAVCEQTRIPQVAVLSLPRVLLQQVVFRNYRKGQAPVLFCHIGY